MPVSPNTANKEQAIQSINKIIEEFDITIKDIQKSQKLLKKDNKDVKWLNKILGYLGAAFIFGGLSLLIGMIWSDLGSAARVIISYGSGLCAFILGYTFNKDKRYTNLSFPFYLTSTFLLPFGMFVFLHEYAGGNDAQLATFIVFGILALQFLIPFLKNTKTFMLFFAYLFFYISIGALFDRMHIPRNIIGTVMGLSIIAFAFYCDKSKHRSICLFWYIIGIGSYLASISNIMFNLYLPNELIGIVVGLTLMFLGWYFSRNDHNIMAPITYVFGSVGFLFSLFSAVKHTPFLDLTFLAVTVFMMIISVRAQSRALLIISTLAIIGFLGYFTAEYFADATGWPIALIIMGFALIVTSSKAIKLGQKISQKV